jgi:hypothetical protein
MNGSNDLDFKNFVKQLKGDTLASHLDLDMTWDIPNLLLNSNVLLSLILAKTSMIPFVADYKSVSSDLSLTNEQATSLQETNIGIRSLQNMLQHFCVQQFSIGSMMKQLMDDTILSCEEIQDIQSIDDLMNFIDNYKNAQQQSGGVNLRNQILNFIGTMILFLIIGSPLSSTRGVDAQIIQQPGQLQVVINGANMIPQINQEILDLTITDLSEIAINKQAIKSKKTLQMSEFVTLYDNDIKEKQKQLITRFTSLFQTQQEGIQFLQQIIIKFNSGLRNFSNGVEDTCLELMSQAYTKQFFKDMKGFDDLDETRKKLEELQQNVTLHNLELAEKTTGAAVGTAITTITGALTGDYSYVVENVMPYLAELGSSLYGSLSNTEKVFKETNTIVSKPQGLLAEYSPQQKIQMEEKAFEISKFYCLLGFNLQLKLNGTEITLIGGKIEYDWLLSTIILLDKNIDYRITTISLNKGANLNELYELSSLKQRLYILKAITQKLNEIINFSMYTHIHKLQISPTPKTLEEIESYFNEQLQYLLNMMEQLNKTFPLRERQIQKNKEIFEANNELDRLELQLHQEQMIVKREFQEKRQNITQAEVEMKASQVANWWIGTKTYLQSYFTVFNNAPEFFGQNLSKFTKAVADAGLGVILQPIGSIFGFLNEILKMFILNPAGYVIIGVGILVLSFFLGGITGVVRVFRYGRDTFLYITYGTFNIIYKIVRTPYGLIYRRVDTIAPQYQPRILSSGRQSRWGPPVNSGGSIKKKTKLISKKTRKIKKHNNRKLNNKRIMKTKRTYLPKKHNTKRSKR